MTAPGGPAPAGSPTRPGSRPRAGRAAAPPTPCRAPRSLLRSCCPPRGRPRLPARDRRRARPAAAGPTCTGRSGSDNPRPTGSPWWHGGGRARPRRRTHRCSRPGGPRGPAPRGPYAHRRCRGPAHSSGSSPRQSAAASWPPRPARCGCARRCFGRRRSGTGSSTSDPVRGPGRPHGRCARVPAPRWRDRSGSSGGTPRPPPPPRSRRCGPPPCRTPAQEGGEPGGSRASRSRQSDHRRRCPG